MYFEWGAENPAELVVNTCSLNSGDSPLSWDVESDMELVLSDMMVSSGRQQPVQSELCSLHANPKAEILLFSRA